MIADSFVSVSLLVVDLSTVRGQGSQEGVMGTQLGDHHMNILGQYHQKTFPSRVSLVSLSQNLPLFTLKQFL